MNLGWKLGAVIAGWAPAGLLDTYDAERRPVGAWMLDWTRAQVALMRGDAKTAALREVVAEFMATRDGMTHVIKQVSGVTQRLDLGGEHPLAGRMVPDILLGDGSRLVDHGHGGGFLLLDRSSDGALAEIASGWVGRVTTMTDGVGSPAGVLARPDGVVVWASDSGDATGLDAVLNRWAGAPVRRPVFGSV